METLAPLTSKEDQIRESIILAAQQLFQQYGLHKVTMEDIARAMGKGKSSLYYYYKSKEEIFEAMLDREIDHVLAKVAEAVAQATTAEEKLYTFCLTRFEELGRKAALHSILVGEVMRDMEFVHHIRRQCRLREGELLKQILTMNSIAAGRPGLSIADLDAVVFVVLGGLHGLDQEMIFNGHSTLLEPAIRILSRALLAGLAA
ncbi:TetR family transcriptional regulator [Hymenobacter sp. HMF4947]|uniref:TetR family transcriptional regulator n=1 Tax=Hymenobacter ginkgonis TaxID=2682976 RepID=A0A7K1T8L1_9BACT|nr:TetR/AcrR family transcriptional regulator [Hymenobacter ginkgonis]MVN74723.1 TetR family transcriptional regulator [Hymenobacter ginkgonis]